jgi:hypothetical protein
MSRQGLNGSAFFHQIGAFLLEKNNCNEQLTISSITDEKQQRA